MSQSWGLVFPWLTGFSVGPAGSGVVETTLREPGL